MLTKMAGIGSMVYFLVLLLAAFTLLARGDKSDKEAQLKEVDQELDALKEEGDDHSNVTVDPSVTNAEGFAALIRQGIDLAQIFGVGPTTRTVFLDNRCTDCDIEIRCSRSLLSTKTKPAADKEEDEKQFEEEPWVPLQQSGGYVIKFVTHLPGWEAGLGNIGFVFWTCEFKDKNRQAEGTDQPAVIVQEVFGGTAPRETMNLYEIRKKGVYRMDHESGRIDARQPIVRW